MRLFNLLKMAFTKLNALDSARKKQLKCVSGVVSFPATTSTGVQSVTVNFPETLPSVPVSIMLTWYDVESGTALTDTYVGKLQAASGSITKKGFKAQMWRYNKSYAWKAAWVAFYF